jgi:hypothetical protein
MTEEYHLSTTCSLCSSAITQHGTKKGKTVYLEQTTKMKQQLQEITELFCDIATLGPTKFEELDKRAREWLCKYYDRQTLDQFMKEREGKWSR